LLAPAAVTVALKSHPAFNRIISLSFVVGISAAAWAGILTSSAAIQVLTLAATNGKSFLPPHIDFLGIVIFCFISILVSSVARNSKKIEHVLRSANEQLESRVNQRTSELQHANTVIQRAHEDLQTREEQFRTLANAIPHLCWMADGTGFILWCNAHWVAYRDYARSDSKYGLDCR
jgi:PAS domain-containing protein